MFILLVINRYLPRSLSITRTITPCQMASWKESAIRNVCCKEGIQYIFASKHVIIYLKCRMQDKMLDEADDVQIHIKGFIVLTKRNWQNEFAAVRQPQFKPDTEVRLSKNLKIHIHIDIILIFTVRFCIYKISSCSCRKVSKWWTKDHLYSLWCVWFTQRLRHDVFVLIYRATSRSITPHWEVFILQNYANSIFLCLRRW